MPGDFPIPISAVTPAAWAAIVHGGVYRLVERVCLSVDIGARVDPLPQHWRSEAVEGSGAIEPHVGVLHRRGQMVCDCASTTIPVMRRIPQCAAAVSASSPRTSAMTTWSGDHGGKARTATLPMRKLPDQRPRAMSCPPIGRYRGGLPEDIEPPAISFSLGRCADVKGNLWERRLWYWPRRSLALPDGRRLCRGASSGTRGGNPVINNHGGLLCGGLTSPGTSRPVNLGIRLISPDRPGVERFDHRDGAQDPGLDRGYWRC